MKEPLSGQWHWNHYEKIKDFLTKYHQDYDIFLIGAGHLAKGYSIHIKELGGIALDVGKVMDSWNGEGLGRMKQLITMNNDFSFKLTKEGKQYEGKF